MSGIIDFPERCEQRGIHGDRFSDPWSSWRLCSACPNATSGPRSNIRREPRWFAPDRLLSRRRVSQARRG